MPKRKASARRSFDAGRYLATSGVKKKILTFRAGQTIFLQGDVSHSVFYLQSGTVKIVVSSSSGKEAVVAILHPGDFFGEGCIAGQPLRVATAVALGPVSVLRIEKAE